MSEIEFALLGMLCVLAFALRLVPMLLKKEYGSDAYYHLFIARKIKAERKYPEKDDGMIPEGPYTYPPLIHYLLRPFSGRGERGALMFISPLVDTVTVAIAFLFADSVGFSQPLLPAVIVAISPMNVVQACSLNPRPLGNLFVVLAILSSFWFWDSGDGLYLGLAVLASALVMLSHKMSMQALIAAQLTVSVVAAIDALDEDVFILLLFLVVPAGIVVAGLLSGLRYLRVVLPDHIKFVRVHLRQGDYATAKKGFPSPIQLIKSDPLPYIAPFLAAYVILELDSSRLIQFLFAWGLGILVLSQGWRWGDAWRHLQFGAFPSAMIVAAWLEAAEYDDLIEIAIQLVVVAALISITAVQLRRTVKGDAAAHVLGALRGLPDEWKQRLNGKLLYSNIRHPAVPYETKAKCLGVNPTSSGIEASFQLRALGDKSLQTMSDYAIKSTGRSLEYFLVFKNGPQPATEGFEKAHESPELSVYIKKS